jgi:hypothetical protein
VACPGFHEEFPDGDGVSSEELTQQRYGERQAIRQTTLDSRLRGNDDRGCTMHLDEILQEQREEILARWRTLIFGTYDDRAANVYKKKSNTFGNPVGTTIKATTDSLYDAICEEKLESEALLAPLSDLIQVRSIQDYSASEAVGIVFLLKKAVRDQLACREGIACSVEELLAFETKVDRMTLHAFDIYMGFRERIYEIAANEKKRVAGMLLKRFGATMGGEPEEIDEHKEIHIGGGKPA